MKAAKGKHREAFEKARARRRLAERAAFFEDDDTEAQEMADTMEFDDQGGDE